MQPPGARPAIGAAENGAIAEQCLHPCELGRRQCERSVPFDRHEWLGAPLAAVALGTAIKETRPYIGTVDPTPVVHRFDLGLRKRRGMCVLLERLHANRATVADLHPKGPPMGRCPNKPLARGMVWHGLPGGLQFASHHGPGRTTTPSDLGLQCPDKLPVMPVTRLP